MPGRTRTRGTADLLSDLSTPAGPTQYASSDDDRRRAALAVATRARDLDEARELLSMLGLDTLPRGDTPGP